MRAVVAPMVANLSFYEAIPGLMDVLPAGLQKEVERLRLSPYEASIAAMGQVLKDWRFDRDLVRPAVAPTIPHHCSDDFMRACARLAREHDVGLHSHVQESKAQVIVGLKKYGKTPTAHLQDLGLLGPDFVAAHGVWLDCDDIARLADHGASVAHNPGSNMLLGNGIAAVKLMLEKKLNVGIGTDGASCCDNQNMYESLRVAAYGSNAKGPDNDQWLASEEILEAATVGSAQALGFDDRLGRIAKGYKADLVFIDLHHINWIPCNDPTNQLVHTEDGTGVHSVMVGGRMVVENRKPVGVDLPALARKAEAARQRLGEINAPNKALFAKLEGLVNAFCPGLAKTPYHINHFAGSNHAH
jgi:cytosine/adenosine deaminase-related metal-dependent hydrolase